MRSEDPHRKRPLLKALQLVDHAIRVLSNIGGAIGCTLIVLVSFLITFNSLSRYLFNRPFLFADEYAQYMLVAIFYLGVGYTLRMGKHVSADVIVRRFSARTQIALNVATSCLGLIVVYIMWIYSWENFFSVYRGGIRSLTPLETPLWIPSAFVAVGMTLFLLDMISHILNGIFRLRRVGAPTGAGDNPL